jgi:pyruvate, water dikinase
MSQNEKYTSWFDEISISDVPSVGGKNASLGEMYLELESQGVKNGLQVYVMCEIPSNIMLVNEFCN